MNGQSSTAVIQIGDPVIDQQHRQIFAWFHRIELAHSRGEGHELIRTTLINLQKYVNEHFAVEERLMKRLGCANYLEHCQQHRELSAELLQLVNDYESGQPVLSIELVHLLRNWLIEHINRMDASIQAYLVPSQFETSGR